MYIYIYIYIYVSHRSHEGGGMSRTTPPIYIYIYIYMYRHPVREARIGMSSSLFYVTVYNVYPIHEFQGYGFHLSTNHFQMFDNCMLEEYVCSVSSDWGPLTAYA